MRSNEKSQHSEHHDPLRTPLHRVRRLRFRPAGRIHDFFTRNYDHPIVEEGVLLRDMILLEQPLGTE